MKGLQLGHGLDKGTTHGPLINQASVEKIHSYVQDAQKKGANILIGGSKADPSQYPGFFYNPTLITEVG